MSFNTILEVFITWGVLLVLFTVWRKFIKRKKVFVIDDNQSDLMLYKINLKLPEYDVQYFASVKGLAFKIALEMPDTVIVDYRLQDNVDGDQVYKFCKRNGIKCVLATAYDGDIIGVDRNEVVKKSANDGFYRTLESIVRGKAA